MIDWLTLKVDACELGAEQISRLRSMAGRVIKISPEGVVEWETFARESIRIDSHQVTVQIGADLTLHGSPARVMGSNNVFGSGDPRQCAAAMIGHVARELVMLLPRLEIWRCTRMDVTHNYAMQDLASVRQALMCLRHAEGGRYQLGTQADTVYWSSRSNMRRGKAYAKGPHLQRQVKRGEAQSSEMELALSERLLRLEVSLRSQWWREQSVKPWHEYSEGELDELHQRYFEPLVGKVEVMHMKDVQREVEEAAKQLGMSEGRAASAYRHWCAIQAVGFEQAKGLVARRTHYQHVKLLRHAGLSWADFQARGVVPLRREALVLSQPGRRATRSVR